MPRILLFILLFSFIIPDSFAFVDRSKEWAERYNFSSLSMNDGLPCNFVDDMIKDSRGFLWLATLGEGVTRYDGSDFVLFNMGSTQTKLRSNFVRTICEDDFGRIWAGSEMGLDVINIYSLEQETPSSFEGKLTPFSILPIHYIYKSKNGHLWLASKNNLYRISFNDQGDVKQIIKVYELSDESECVRTIIQRGDEVLFNNGISIISLKENEDRYDWTTEKAPLVVMPLLNSRVQSIYHKENELWVGTISGLFRFDLLGGAVRWYLHDPQDGSSLSQNFITDIAETSDHYLLVSTFKGINVYNALTDNFERIDKDGCGLGANNHLSNRLNCDFINCMLIDDEMVWVGTEVGGLNLISRRKLYVDNYLHSPSQPGSISHNPVNAIYEDSKGTLWVGTVEGGLNRKKKGEDYFSHFTTDSPTNLSHNSVSCFTSDAKGRIWVGTWGGGIGRVEINQRGDATFHPISSEDFTDFSDGFIGVLSYDAINNALWVGTAQSVYVHLLESGKVLEPLKGAIPGGIEGCTGYFIDDKSHLWIGMAAGLCRIDLHTLHAPRLVYQLWRNKLDDPESKIPERVTYITQSKDGTMWVGSNGYGFYYSVVDDNGEYHFKGLTTEDGLVNNSVRGIKEDLDGNIWVSTTNGLSYYNRQQDSFVNYGERDGLACSQFYWNAIEYGREGELYLGSVAGLSIVKPGVQTTKLVDIPIAFTQTRVASKDVQPVDGKLKMHERDKTLYLEFAALDYSSPTSSAYSYRLKGFDNQWVRVSANRRTAAFTNLDAGTYQFELRYAPYGREWQQLEETLTIEVVPYFYKTVGFIALVSLLVLFIGYQLWNWRIRSLKLQQELLHRKVEERTRTLEQQKMLLTTQTNELSRQNELLVAQNEKITKQKTQILTMSKKVQELTVDRLSFFTNITHEFRTPLTLIIGPIERALKLSSNPLVVEQLNLVERNSKYLLSLVNQLMDFRKVESGNMSIMLKAGDFKSFFEEVIAPFRDFAASHGITLDSHLRLPDRSIMFDEDSMRKVFTNLVGNAMKFTPKGGKVSVFVSTMAHQGSSSLFIAIKDTGSGIPEPDIKRVFNRFYQSRNQQYESMSGQSGTGIGLYLCKRIIQLYDGEIAVKNNRNVGCSFRIMLPLQLGDNSAIDEAGQQEMMPMNLKRDVESQTIPMNILVVEDNKDMRDYISSILRSRYTILEAGHGLEALEVLKKQSVDFIISDLMMPMMNGIELSRQIKSDFTLSHIPLLMLTAKTADESRIEGFKVGVDEYLLKPFEEELLLTRIDNLLENRRRLQQKFSISMEVDTLNIDCESADKRFMDKVMEVVKDNFRNSYWEVSDFVDAMGVSKSLVNKKMQTLTGQSAGQFIRNYRLNIARELLGRNAKTKGLNISEVAYEVGFNDPKYFTRCFTKQFGVTPSSLLD